MSAGIRIRATRPGFIGGQLKVLGSEFTLLKPEFFSATWMEKIEPAQPDKPGAPESDEVDSPGELTSRRRRRKLE
jgi:hypothetical protein